jgi:hypothetical protein
MSGKKTFVHRIATVAAVGIEPSTLEELKSAWRMFGIEVRLVPYEGLRTLKDQTINAFVVRLGSGAKPILQAIRSTDKYQHTLIYGVGEDADIVGMAEFEISVLMPDLNEDSVIEAIQNTYQLLLNQMRRHARIPMVIPVKVTAGAFTINAVSRNISAGGIRLSLVEPAEAQMVALRPDDISQISFEAPHAARFHLPSTLVRKSKNSVGFEFQVSPDQQELKHWLDQHLQK